MQTPEIYQLANDIDEVLKHKHTSATYKVHRIEQLLREYKQAQPIIPDRCPVRGCG